MTLTRIDGRPLKQTAAFNLAMSTSTPPASIVYEPLIKSNYQAVLGRDVAVLTQLEPPHWLVVVLAAVPNSPERTVVAMEKSLDLSAALATVHRRSAHEVSRLYAANGTYNSPAGTPAPEQPRSQPKRSARRASACCGRVDDAMSHKASCPHRRGDDDDADDTDSSSSSPAESEDEGLTTDNGSDDEGDGLSHIRRPPHHRCHATRTGGSLLRPGRLPPQATTTAPRVGAQAAVPPSAGLSPPASAAPVAHRVSCPLGPGMASLHETVARQPPPRPRRTGVVPVVEAFRPQVLERVVHDSSKALAPGALHQQNHHQQQKQPRVVNLYHPSGVPIYSARPNEQPPVAGAPLAATPEQPAPAARPVSISIHWLGRGRLLVTDHCEPLRRRILDRAMQIARARSAEFGAHDDAGSDGGRMVALLRRVRAGEAVHELTSRIDDLSPLLVGMGPTSLVGFPCFDVEVDLQPGQGP